MANKTNGVVLKGSLLPEGESRSRFFGAGLVLESIAVTIVVLLPMLMPQKFEAAQHYWVIPIEAPHIEAWKPQPKPAPVIKRVVAKVVPKPAEVPVPKPKIYNPVVRTPILRPVVAKKVQAPVQLAKVFPDPSPSILLGSSAIPTLKKPRQDVQTGGFGDPEGVPDNGRRDRNPNITQLGSYDLPAGTGQGNGTGGSKGSKGVVASTGFGNEVAAGTGVTGNRGAVHQGGFADEAATASAPKARQNAATSNTKPVEILFKPKPEYTSEARTKKIEGDVLLQVVFTASGEVRVQRIVQGLGFGLDDSAESAARQIRFRPAELDGRAVDSDVVVHITFALAY